MSTSIYPQDTLLTFKGRHRTITRIIWFFCMAMAITIYVISIPSYLDGLAATVDIKISPDIPPRLAAFLLNMAGGVSFLSALITLAVAVLLFWRGGDGRMAYFTSLLLIGQGINSGPHELALETVNRVGATSSLTTLTIMGGIWFWWFFPNARMTPRWLRYLVLPSFLMTVVWWLTDTQPLTPDQVATPLTIVSLVVLGGLYLSILVVQIHRYRRVYAVTERQQVRWILFGALLEVILVAFLILMSGGLNSDPDREYTVPLLIAGNLWFLRFAIFPVVLGLAALRYRLWAVDLIIRRTLQYALLTILLGGTYFGGVVLLQNILVRVAGQESPLAVVASTLAIAALFNPMRHRVQNFIDRRFDRRKYDAQRTLDEFAASARDEVDMVKLEQSLVNVVNQTMQPDSVSLWVAPNDGP